MSPTLHLLGILYPHMRWILIVLLLFLLFLIFYAYRTYEKEIYVERLNPLMHENKYGRKTVMDKNNVIYNTTNSIFHCHFHFKEVHSKLREREVYIIRCYGHSISFLGWHPNILEVRKK